MANPRQRNKARSSKTTKPSLAAKRRAHHRLRKPPALNGPEVLQEGWDKHKTVFQNYKALGLLASLPIPSSRSSRPQRTKLNLPSDAPNLGAGFAGFGQIVRDEEGNVVDIIIPDEPEQEEEEEGPVGADPKTAVVEALEDLASKAAPIKRHSSTSEKTWLRDLVLRYGSDFSAMARDKKLNVWQKTEGEIKRMVRKAGGVDKLRSS